MEKIKLFACVLALGALLSACSNSSETANTGDAITDGGTAPAQPENEEGGPDVAEENPNQAKPGIDVEDLGDVIPEKKPVIDICDVKPWLCNDLDSDPVIPGEFQVVPRV